MKSYQSPLWNFNNPYQTLNHAPLNLYKSHSQVMTTREIFKTCQGSSTLLWTRKKIKKNCSKAESQANNSS